MTPLPQHTAQYDDDGNIILPEPENTEKSSSERVSRSQNRIDDSSSTIWNVIEEIAQEHTSQGASIADDLLTIRHGTKFILSGTLQDVEEELRKTSGELKSAFQGSKESLRSLPSSLRTTYSAAMRMLAAPLQFKKKSGRKLRPRSKTTLFLIDTVRFGGTFAAIFLLLFVGINAPSFWRITKAQLALGEDIHTVQSLQKLTGNSVDPLRTSTIVQNDRAVGGSLLALLPTVGPPENRLVIPKLGENIPIVNPSTEALLKEDWTQFENDIQGALRGGVVHYPGTAKPGQAGNFFVTGHSSYYPWDSGRYKEVFARLNELSIGDEYSVYYGGDLHMYRVTKKLEVKPTNVSVLDQPTDKRLATLMTCTPIGTTLRRLIVQAEEIDPITKTPLHVGEKQKERLAPAKLEMLPI